MIVSAFNAPPSDLDLKNDVVHIWFVTLDQPQYLIQNLAGTLSGDEKKRVERFHFAHDCKRFIVGRGLLRVLLAHYLSVRPDRLQLCYGQNGKPFIADFLNKNKLHFNLSHSEGYALFAFAYDREIGVDIESIHHFSEMEEIAKRFFSIKENLILQSLTNRKKKAAFFDFWTRKEALAKAVGKGLSYAFDKIDVSQCPNKPIMTREKKDELFISQKWYADNLMLCKDYSAALAIQGYLSKVAKFRL